MNQQPRIMFGLIGALVLGVAFAALLAVGGRSGGPALGLIPAGAFNDAAYGFTNEDRARMPDVFIGTVVERLGEANIAEPESEPFLVPLYSVEVETTLKGTAAGQVQVTFVENAFAEPGIGTLEEGRRYLFAGVGPEGAIDSYTMDAGLGNVPIASDAEAEALIAEFEQLFARSPTPIAIDYVPCEGVAGPPVATISPRRGPPGAEVRVRVENVAPTEVGIWWRTFNHRVGIAEVRADCTAVEVIKVPNDANAGSVDIIVSDARALDDRVAFEVTN